MESVRSWTQTQGFDYRFIDDRMFDYAPAWYREKVKGSVLLISDLARLRIARELLEQGYHRTIWVDADVLVFAPETFRIDVTSEYAFCSEVWLKRKSPKQALRSFLTSFDSSPWICRKKVNNAITVFVIGNSLLDFYIHAAEGLVRNRSAEQITHWDVGVSFLSRLHQSIGLPLLHTVGAFSPAVMHDLSSGDTEYLSRYVRELEQPVHAANLCSSLVGKTSDGIHLTEEMFTEAVERLTLTRGEVVNQCR
jgi:hypothetical protein